MVLAYYGIRVSERRLAALAGCKPARHPEGTSAEGIVRTAGHFGLRSTVCDRASIGDLRQTIKAGHPPIVDWFSGDEGHYSVVVDVTPTRIVLRDPERRAPHRLRHADFERVWFDFSGRRIERPRDIHVRRMIVVRPPPT